MARRYRLTTDSYTAIVRAVWTALDLDRPVVVGCSMGGAIVLKLAADYQRELRGIIGLESSAFAPGRYNDFLHHPAIHGGELAATYTYALCAPQSPESSARENWWYYSQGGPGVYAGDVHFYSIDWDGREDDHDHRYQRLQGVSADWRVRLLVHAGDDEAGGRGHSRRAAGHHEGHRSLPDGRELSALPRIPAAGARLHEATERGGGNGLTRRNGGTEDSFLFDEWSPFLRFSV